MKQLYTTQEIAELLKVSEKTIYNFRQEGMPFKTIGRSVRFDADEVMKWLGEINKRALK